MKPEIQKYYKWHCQKLNSFNNTFPKNFKNISLEITAKFNSPIQGKFVKLYTHWDPEDYKRHVKEKRLNTETIAAIGGGGEVYQAKCFQKVSHMAD